MDFLLVRVRRFLEIIGECVYIYIYIYIYCVPERALQSVVLETATTSASIMFFGRG